jgi:anti-anti-sigma factor
MADLDQGGRAAQASIETRADASGAPLLSVSGELDISNVGTLEHAVATALAGNPERIIFDLSGLRFIDSAGIAVLIRTAGKGSAVQLRRPTESVRRVVELTGLERLLTIEP